MMLLLLKMILTVVFVKAARFKCPISLCVCHPMSIARCINHGPYLDYIPALPDYVRNLEFVNNSLPNITRQTFSNLSANSITHLNLTENGIKTISQDAFLDFKSIIMVDLSSNTGILPDALERSFKSMRFVKGGFLQLNNLFQKGKNPSKLFRPFANRNLYHLSLRQNSVMRIKKNWFKGLNHLESLDISNNNIVIAQFKGLDNLLDLHIDHNNLLHVPKFCFNNDSSTNPKLTNLSMTHNKIRSLRTNDFQCIRGLRFVYLSNNPVSCVQDNVFASLKIRYLQLTEFNHALLRIQKYAFNSSHITKLSLANDHFKFRHFYPETIFRFCPQLEILILSWNMVPNDSSTTIKMFGQLRNLTKLILVSVGWSVIPNDLFHRMKNLRVLELGENKIWSPSVNSPFESVHDLRTLGLNSNKINTIERNSFPDSLIESLRTLDLGNNPFVCNCDILWFVSWLNRTKIKIRSYPNNYNCDLPKTWKDKKLITFSEDCTDYGNIKTKILAATGSGTVAIVLIIALVIYRTRWHIRYWIYLLRSSNNSYTKLRNTNYLYDGFVVYCDADREWVHEKLVPFFEEEHGRKLCIHYRDFQAGKLIVDNIVESMNASQNIVLVMSNAFARSQWCQFEVLLAQKRLLNNENEMLVTILLEEVNSKNFTHALKLILTSTTYAVWNEDGHGQRLFWNQLLSTFNSHKRPDYSTINT